MSSVVLLSRLKRISEHRMEGQDNLVYNRISKLESTRTLGNIESCYSQSFP